MSNLPKWVKKIAEECCVQQCETPLIDALAIAWEALNKCNSPENDWENGEIGTGSTFRKITRDAMRRIEELGK